MEHDPEEEKKDWAFHQPEKRVAIKILGNA